MEASPPIREPAQSPNGASGTTTAAEGGPGGRVAVSRSLSGRLHPSGTPCRPPSTLINVSALAERYVRAVRTDPSEQDGRDFDSALAAFEDEQGTLIASHFCAPFPAAVLKTRNPPESGGEAGEDKLHLSFPPSTSAPGWIPELLLDCYGLHIEVRQVLSPPCSQICLEMIFILMTQLLRLMEVRAHGSAAASGARANDPGSAERKIYQDQLADARAFFVRSAQRTAQTSYFFGMLAGGALTLTALVAFALAWWHPVLGVPDTDFPFFFNCLVVGSIGGFVSVMQRMTSGSLDLRYRAGRQTLMMLGMFRPLIGAVFAVVLFVLLKSSLLPIEIPKIEESARQFHFYFAVAFFAGFSERWVQDMLVAGQASLRVSSRDAASSAATPPARP